MCNACKAPCRNAELAALLQEFCSVLAELHDKAPEHSWRASKREIEAVFGKSVEELFESIDYNALASGSIAQVPARAE